MILFKDILKGVYLIFIFTLVTQIIKVIYILLGFFSVYANNFTLYINRIPESQKFWFLLVGFFLLVYIADTLLRYMFKITFYLYKQLSQSEPKESE